MSTRETGLVAAAAVVALPRSAAVPGQSPVLVQKQNHLPSGTLPAFAVAAYLPVAETVLASVLATATGFETVPALQRLFPLVFHKPVHYCLLQ